MDKKAQKKEILRLVGLHYHNEKRALEWYKKPHNLLDDVGGYSYNRKPRSPEKMVKDGEGDKVIKWLKFILDR